MAARSFVSAHRLWGAAIAVVLAGCLPRAEQPLAVAVGPFPGYQPLYLARELGWYEPETLRLVEYSAGTQSSRAFRNGVVDVAAVTLDEALLLAAEGLPLRIVAVLHSSTGGIFLPNPALERAGLEPDAAEPEHGQPPAIGAGPPSDHTHPPHGRVDVLIVRAEVLEQRCAAIQHLLGGWLKALEYLYAQPADAHARMAPRLGLTTAELARSLQALEFHAGPANLRWLSGPDARLLSVADRIMTSMLATGLLAAPVEALPLLAPTPIEASLAAARAP